MWDTIPALTEALVVQHHRAEPQYEPCLRYLLTRLLPKLRGSPGNTIFGPGDVQDKSRHKRVEIAQRDRLQSYMSR
jgi:hypothetical protein